MFSSWLPLEDEPAGGMIIVRNGSRSGGRRLVRRRAGTDPCTLSAHRHLSL